MISDHEIDNKKGGREIPTTLEYYYSKEGGISRPPVLYIQGWRYFLPNFFLYAGVDGFSRPTFFSYSRLGGISRPPCF